MLPWLIVGVVVALCYSGYYWYHEHHRRRVYKPLNLADPPSNVRVLRAPGDVQEAARKAADTQMEAVRRMAAAEERWRGMTKEE